MDRDERAAGDSFHRILLTGIVALAAVLRLAWLGKSGLWTDECTTAVWARLPVGELLAQVKADCQAPLFYLVEKVVLALVGSGEWQARLLPAACGIVTVPLIYLAGRRLVSPRVGVLSAFLLAIHPLHVHYSREARNYSLLVLACVVVLLAAHHLHRNPGVRPAVIAALAFLVAAYTHGLGALYVGFIVLPYLALIATLPGPRRRTASWLLAMGLAAVGFLPWLPAFLGQTRGSAAIYSWAVKAWQSQFPFQVPLSLAALTHAALPPTRNLVEGVPWQAWPTLAACLALAWAGVANRKEWRDRRAPWTLLVAGLLPLVFLFAWSWIKSPLYVVGRVEAAALPPLLLLVASGVRALPPRARLVVPVAAALLALVPLQSLRSHDTRSEERAMARGLAKALRPGDVVVVTGVMRHAFEYYLGREAPGAIVRAWPSQLERHPAWIDWSEYTDLELHGEATKFTQEAAGLVRRNSARHAWLLLQPDPPGQPRNARLAEAMDRDLSLVKVQDGFGPWGHQLRCYLVPAVVSR